LDALTLYRFIIENLEGRSFSHDRLAAWLRENTVGVDNQKDKYGVDESAESRQQIIHLRRRQAARTGTAQQ
jgi:hypothetical protein